MPASSRQRRLVKVKQVCFANWIPISIGMTNDTTAIILDPSVEGTGQSIYDRENATWSVPFPNYTISGISSCNSIDGGTVGTAHAEYNFEQGETAGVNCWCRMMTPVRSAWVFRYTFPLASDCNAGCASNCGSNFLSSRIFRTPFFRTAGQ